jgi:hypothetical protein
MTGCIAIGLSSFGLLGNFTLPNGIILEVLRQSGTIPDANERLAIVLITSKMLGEEIQRSTILGQILMTSFDIDLAFLRECHASRTNTLDGSTLNLLFGVTTHIGLSGKLEDEGIGSNVLTDTK